VNLFQTGTPQEFNRFEVTEKKIRNGPAEPNWADPIWASPDPSRHQIGTLALVFLDEMGRHSGANPSDAGSSGGSPGGLRLAAVIRRGGGGSR
jgi:hypothetical protein